ncbi:macrophage migration inhibitory factor [Colletotrichum graminicola]|uniref:L-dopachrome isomerase n=1 Tax=Colletotrichum graminicola (strain M1.001 / M2 / FGSC 10212) TaxID=645133 RepID=E3QCA6_COLGM|nr:macrophage migration inhibitory factor [Colletotrichum graminicola M1.001]EFQ28494.1 macrophage migration inhibitory factor [Colletotrichum graminicola M1.001]WDK16041.1 macrophage migration inhibitory factor [Colletotrichum graminicola]
MADPISPPSSPLKESNTTSSSTTSDKPSSHPPVTAQNKLTFAERKMNRRPSTAPTPIIEGDRGLTRDVHRSLPGDPRNNRKSKTPADLAKRRSSYYEEAFQYDRESNLSKDRVLNEAVVMTDLRTNVIINDEFSFITDFSYQLSVRYQRPVSSIVVNLQHGACMLFGGTFEPAYTMSIHALPLEVGIAKNKRNSALLQKHLQEALGVPPARGYVKFVEVPADCMAINGKTTASQISEVTGEDEETIAERRARNRKSLGTKSMSALRHGSIVGTKRGSVFDFRRESVASPRKDAAQQELTPPHSATDAPLVPPIPETYAVNSTSSEKDTPFKEVEKAPTNTYGEYMKKSKPTKRKGNFVSSLFSRSPRNDAIQL